ncbi:Beta-barrel assembly-enhancing protease, partial [termite gut metagenome]
KGGAAEDMKKNLELNPKELNALNGTFDKQEEQFDTLLGFRH